MVAWFNFLYLQCKDFEKLNLNDSSVLSSSSFSAKAFYFRLETLLSLPLLPHDVYDVVYESPRCIWAIKNVTIGEDSK